MTIQQANPCIRCHQPAEMIGVWRPGNELDAKQLGLQSNESIRYFACQKCIGDRSPANVHLIGVAMENYVRDHGIPPLGGADELAYCGQDAAGQSVVHPKSRAPVVRFASDGYAPTDIEPQSWIVNRQLSQVANAEVGRMHQHATDALTGSEPDQAATILTFLADNEFPDDAAKARRLREQLSRKFKQVAAPRCLGRNDAVMLDALKTARRQWQQSVANPSVNPEADEQMVVRAALLGCGRSFG